MYIGKHYATKKAAGNRRLKGVLLHLDEFCPAAVLLFSSSIMQWAKFIHLKAESTPATKKRWRRPKHHLHQQKKPRRGRDRSPKALCARDFFYLLISTLSTCCMLWTIVLWKSSSDLLFFVTFWKLELDGIWHVWWKHDDDFLNLFEV